MPPRRYSSRSIRGNWNRIASSPELRSSRSGHRRQSQLLQTHGSGDQHLVSGHFIRTTELRSALTKLGAINPFFGTCYLAFKRHGVPIGTTTSLVFARINREFLEKHYRPCSTHTGFYHPFHASETKPGWVSEEYARTSLQRIAKDTFQAALIHKSKSNQWGWTHNYVEKLAERLDRNRIPAFELAIWLYHRRELPQRSTPASLVDLLFLEHNITELEQNELFNRAVPHRDDKWLGTSTLSDEDVLQVIGHPPEAHSDRASSLLGLTLSHVGPAKSFKYEPTPRLNLLTGDNSLGKTFLLECAWWALTGEWLDRVAAPSTNAKRGSTRIEFELATGTAASVKGRSTYDWDKHSWEDSRRNTHPGLAIYARFDGSFAVWDPERRGGDSQGAPTSAGLTLSRSEIWDGKFVPQRDRTLWLCNGLIRDWVTWQTGGERYRELWTALETCLNELSPSPTELLRPGAPVRMPFDAREMPTVAMPYGEIPVVHASAGVQRIIAMAYVLVWAWHEHVAFAGIAQRKPQRRIAFLIDEVEAHLHPRWQRVIVPAIVGAVSRLSQEASIQAHVATHSPMVLASAEPLFDAEQDSLHHLKLEDRNVILEQLPFVRRGRVDMWLTSPVFGLAQARSVAAESAIASAIDLQQGMDPSSEDIAQLHKHLVRVLAPDDGFWPRWRHFALSHGVDK
jgi:hypothetical protein